MLKPEEVLLAAIKCVRTNKHEMKETRANKRSTRSVISLFAYGGDVVPRTLCETKTVKFLRENSKNNTVVKRTNNNDTR